METFDLVVGAVVARCVRVQEREALPEALAAVGLTGSRPVVVVVGGAGGSSAADVERLAPVFRRGLVPAIERARAVAVDGGTDAGVMRLLGRARDAHRATFSLVGVAAEGTVRVPGSARIRDDAADPAPHHTHLVLVRDPRPGAPTSWGDEAPWISWTAGVLAGPSPSVTVLVNGGDIAYRDAAASLEAHRPLVVLAGSGRTADEITAALRGEPADPRAREIAASGLVSWVDADHPARVDEALSRALESRPRRRDDHR